jgi:hypothetical protein
VTRFDVTTSLALVLLGILLLREHVVPPAGALLLCAEGLTFPASRIPDIGALAVVSDVLGVLALTVIVVHLRRRDPVLDSGDVVHQPRRVSSMDAGPVLSEHR